MARQAKKSQNTSRNPRRRTAQAALHKAPEAAVQKTPSATSQETKTGTRGDSANGEAMEALIKANEAMLQGMAKMQHEIMEFGNARLRLDVETQDALAHCADMREAFQVQADFTQNAMRDYAEEMAKLIELSAKIGRDCWGPLENATRAAFDSAATR